MIRISLSSAGFLLFPEIYLSFFDNFLLTFDCLCFILNITGLNSKARCDFVLGNATL